jgi:diguanylate cyclase (GGDEF)-like protein/PAS domain S-box-containing protein
MPEPMSAQALADVLAAWVAVSDTPISISAPGAHRALLYVNPAFEAVSGYSAGELIGRDAMSLLARSADEVAAEAADRVVDEALPAPARVLKLRADGSVWWSELHLAAVRDGAGRWTHVVGLQLDVTEQVAAEEQASHAATHDALTGLVTRAHFLESLDREVARAARDHTSLAVLFLDVDHLKSTNDAHGHAAGDALLVEVAQRLRGRLRGADLAGRFGGDEFLVLLVGLPTAPADAARSAARVVGELVRCLAEPVQTGQRLLTVSVSIGTSVFPGEGRTAAELVARADASMYRQRARR